MLTIFRQNKLLIAAIIIMCQISCKNHADDSDARERYVIPDSLMKTLTVDTVKTGKVKQALRFNGMVDYNADKLVNVFPLISGNVQMITVMPGDYVKAGQVLGVIKSAEMANYSSALITAETNVQLSQRQLQQQNDLYKSGMASEVDLINAKAAYRQAQAALQAARRILQINGNSSNGQFEIKSPVDGFVVQKNVTNGMAIRTDNGNPLFVISDLKKVWVQGNVYEENVNNVHVGDTVSVSTISYPDKVYKGRVSTLMNVLDPNTKVMKMRVVLNNPDYSLKPQMFATVTLNNTLNQEATAISSSDLIFDHSQYYVIIFKSQKDLEIRPVEVISINGSEAYIKKGVNPGEHLIGSDAILIYGSLNS